MTKRTMLRLIIVLTVVVAGCGDDATQSGGDDEPTADAEQSEPEDGETASDEVDETEEFCTAFAPLNAEADEIFAEGNPSAEDLRDLVERMAVLEVPDEIADDFALQNEGFALFADGLGGDADAQAQLQEEFDDFDSAGERLEPFMREVCGLEFGD